MASKEFEKLAELKTDICNMPCHIDTATGAFIYNYYKVLSEEQVHLIKSVLLKTIIPEYKTNNWTYYKYRDASCYCFINNRRRNKFNFCFHTGGKEWDGVIRGNPYM